MTNKGWYIIKTQPTKQPTNQSKLVFGAWPNVVRWQWPKIYIKYLDIQILLGYNNISPIFLFVILLLFAMLLSTTEDSSYTSIVWFVFMAHQPL